MRAAMIDTWATVGSCAQIGKNVHLSGGVGIGGVLEPPQATPVIVEDGAFIGSRCIVVEGVRVEREAVLGAGVVLTASTPIVDVRGRRAGYEQRTRSGTRGRDSGTLPKRFPPASTATPCALIIGTRNESTDLKTSLNATLREYDVARMNPRVLQIAPSLDSRNLPQRSARLRSISGLGEPSPAAERRALRGARCERVRATA